MDYVLNENELALLEKLRDLHRAYRATFKKRGLSQKVLIDLKLATVDDPKRLNLTHPHPETLAVFREGRRSIGQHICFMLDDQNFTEKGFIKILTEERKNGR